MHRNSSIVMDVSSLKVALLSAIAGRGTPAEPKTSAREAEVVEAAFRLKAQWRTTVKDVRDSCAGCWRLVYTTDEALLALSSLPGGPVADCFESIGDDTVHTAAATRLPMYFILLLLAFPALVYVASATGLGFLGGAHLVVLASAALSSVAPTGLFASRRRGFHVSDDLVASSRLERDVISLVASRLGFARKLQNPMPGFTQKFDKHEGSKDPLAASLLLGWRVLPRVLSFHVLSASKGVERREEVLFVDDSLRVVLGGNVSLVDGSVAQALSVFVRV